MTQTSQPPGGFQAITGGMQRQARIGSIVAFWRELVAACDVDSAVAGRMEDSLWHLTDPERAEDPPLEEHAICLFMEVFGNDPAIAQWAEQMAEQYIEEGNLLASARLLAQAQQIYDSCRERAAVNRADTLRALGQRLFRDGKFAQAKAPLDAALKAYRHLSVDSRGLHTAETAFDLAVTLAKLEDTESGYVDSCFELAAALFESLVGSTCRQRVECLLAYGKYELGRGETHYAAIHLRKALFALRKWETRDESLEADVLSALSGRRGT